MKKIILWLMLLWLTLGAPVLIWGAGETCRTWVFDGSAGELSRKVMIWRCPNGALDPNAKFDLTVTELPGWVTSVEIHDRLTTRQLSTVGIDVNDIQEAEPPACSWAPPAAEAIEKSIWGVVVLEYTPVSAGVFHQGTVTSSARGSAPYTEPVSFNIDLPAVEGHMHCRLKNN